jgi:hypothetical protein
MPRPAGSKNKRPAKKAARPAKLLIDEPKEITDDYDYAADRRECLRERCFDKVISSVKGFQYDMDIILRDAELLYDYIKGIPSYPIAKAEGFVGFNTGSEPKERPSFPTEGSPHVGNTTTRSRFEETHAL